MIVPSTNIFFGPCLLWMAQNGECGRMQNSVTNFAQAYKCTRTCFTSHYSMTSLGDFQRSSPSKYTRICPFRPSRFSRRAENCPLKRILSRENDDELRACKCARPHDVQWARFHSPTNYPVITETAGRTKIWFFYRSACS